METIAIEAKMAMAELGAPEEAKREMAGAHFLPPVPVLMAPSEAEERDIDNTSNELVIMAPHSNVCDDRPNTNESWDGVIIMDVTKETTAENMGLGKGSQLGWTIYNRDTELLPVPIITLASSWITPKRMSISNFTQVGTPKPLVSPLRTSKQQLLPLARASPAPFPHQDCASDEVTSLSESTHSRGNHNKETDNLTASTSRRLFKWES